MVTVVVTSYNRPDLLERTISSFNEFNTYPVSEVIIIEDSGNIDMFNFLKSKYSQYTLILNNQNIGLIPSIDRAYSQVKTPYVFHTEDDYEYYKPGFIEKSLVILENNEKIMQVYIRTMNESDNPIEPEIYKVGEVEYQLFGSTKDGNWFGFCFQCGLRKMSAYNKIKPFSQWVGKIDFLALQECKIGKAYFEKGYKVAILPEGHARHTGQMRSTCGNYNI